MLSCQHLCDTTTRYDRGQKELSFLLVCAVCGTESLIETIQYEPRFTEPALSEPATATIHELPVRPSVPSLLAA